MQKEHRGKKKPFHMRKIIISGFFLPCSYLWELCDTFYFLVKYYGLAMVLLLLGNTVH